LTLNPDHLPARALLASSYASQHKFGEALETARALYDSSPANIDALATLADVYLETGRYGEGEKAIRTLRQKAGDVPAVLARRALVAELKGQTLEAVNLLRQALSRMRRDAEPAADVAWYEARLGDVYFHCGCLSESEKHFDAALGLQDAYPIALAGLAGVRVSQGRFPDAADLYARAVAQSPSPRRLFELGAVEESLGRTQEAQRHYQQGEEIARSAGAGNAAYDRELSAFYAGRVGRAREALALAERDLAVRKDVRAYDTLAWALFRNQRSEEAAAAIVEAMKLRTRDFDFYSTPA
jgi:tetratricopeptide (TPR) repeat protein